MITLMTLKSTSTSRGINRIEILIVRCSTFPRDILFDSSVFSTLSVEVIDIETTRSLLQDHGMGFDDIDRSGILPLPVDKILRAARRRYNFPSSLKIFT